MTIKSLTLIASLCLSAATAQSLMAQPAPAPASASNVIIEPLDWVDKSRMDKEFTSINQFAQSKIGRQFHGTLEDLAVIQQLIDRGFVANDDQDRQVELGLVMARVFLADFPLTLEWQVYRDQLGRSRALCVKGLQECIFPMTLLVRRMQVGTRPDVSKIYYETVEGMANFLPKQPYSGEVLHRLTPINPQ